MRDMLISLAFSLLGVGLVYGVFGGIFWLTQRGKPPRPKPSVPTYAHPMGWPMACAGGIAYGLVLGGLPWIIWTAIALEYPPWQADAFFGMLLVLGPMVVLGDESMQRDFVKKGSKNLGKPLDGAA